MDVWLLRVLFSGRKAGGMGEICLLWGKGFWGKHVWDAGVHCPLLVAPISFLQDFCLLLQLLDPSLGFCHELHVRVRRIAPKWHVSSRGPTCFTNTIIIHPASQQSSVHVDVRRNQLVGAELQHGAIDKRGLGVTQHFVFKSCRDRLNRTEERGKTNTKGCWTLIQKNNHHERSEEKT